MLGTYVAAALTQVVRQSPPAEPWRHTVVLLGAEQLPDEILDGLADACETTGTGLVLAYRSIPAPVRDRLGRGHAVVAFMRLGNAADAKAASEQLGTEHRFVLAQLTDTAGTSVGDTSGDSYTSTLGTSQSRSESSSVSQTTGRSRGLGAASSSFVPLDPGTASRSQDRSESSGFSESDSLTTGISASTAWGISTSRAVTASDSQARTVQRSREFLIEPHELQQLPPSAMIVTYSGPAGRRVLVADANPGIFGLPTATLRPLAEARRAARDLAAAAVSAPSGPVTAPAPRPGQDVSWRDTDGEAQLPPNLGPPPERLDWRRREDD